MTTTQQAIPANEFDATNAPVFSVYAPHFKNSRLIARNVTYPRARQIAEHHGAFVFHTADVAYFQPEARSPIMTTQTTEDIVLAALPTEADEPDFTWRPTAWDLVETTSLPIGKVRWALRQLGIRQALVICTYERWGHTDVHYARTES